MATAPESSSSSSSNYEVFLSFRGPDTRKTFTDHLYTALIHNGIRTFRDEDELEIGEPIMPNLLKFIQESRISIPIISPDYASSRSCLEELAMIMECKRMIGQIIMPIFFHVDVGDVKNQTGSFAEPFCSHEKRFQMDKVMEWRSALREVGKLKGYDSKNVENGHEARLVQVVLREVLTILNNAYIMDVAKYPIGIESCVEDMLRLLDVGSQDVRFVGVHGMGGLGKTTIAKAVFNQIHRWFIGSAFIRDVREEASRDRGLVYLQNKLVCDILNLETNHIRDVDIGKNMIKRRMSAKKVLVILDDVDKREQLEALVGEPDWFGPGSRIIITTRDLHVLNVLGVDNVYKPEELDDDQSLQLLSWHTFRSGQPPNDFVDLSKKVALIAGGLPLVLEVLGSSLYEERRPEAWEETLEKLKRVPKEDIHNKLIISFDTLDVDQKKMFLDIACLLIGIEEKIATEIWKGCGLSPLTGIKALVQKSLITIRDNKLRMHNQLRDVGRAIVYQQSPEDPRKRSRLWCHEEVLYVLANPMGTKNIEGLTISVKGDVLTTEAFADMSNLRLLRVEGARLVGNFEDLPPLLRWLCLKGCFLDFKLNKFHLEKLVVLDLSETNIARIDWHQNKKVAANLKVISLRGCRYLEEFPTSICNLTSLVSLDLVDCYKLNKLPSRLGVMESLTELLFRKSAIEQLPDSIGLLKNLKRLDLSECRSLTRLPDSLGKLESLRDLSLDFTSIRQIPVSIGLLKKLETLRVSSCKLLTMLPSSIGAMESLTELLFRESAIEQLPDSIGLLKNLKTLDLTLCRSLTRLPDSLGELESLRELFLGVTSIRKIIPVSIGSMKLINLYLPDSINNMRNLISISITGITITELPDAFCSLEKLEELAIRECKLLGRLPDWIGNLRNLKSFRISEAIITELPDAFGSLEKLENLAIRECKLLGRLPDSIDNLRNLKSFSISKAIITELPDAFGSFQKLGELYLFDCKKLVKLPNSMGKLKLLERFKVRESSIVELPKDFGMLSNLNSLEISSCQEFKCFPDIFGSLTRLTYLNLENNSKLTVLPPSLSRLRSLVELKANHCNLSGPGAIPDDFGELSSLRILDLGYNNFRSLPTSINDISLLQHLSLRNCTELASLPELPTSLIHLDLTNCISMERLPDLSNLKRLMGLSLVNCDKLPEIQGLERLESLEILHMGGCSTFANTLKKSLSQGVFEGLRRFSFPGSEIPKWFTYQKILSSKLPRVGNSDDEIDGWILCFIFAIDENTEKDLHQPYAATFIPNVELQIWRDHKELYSEQLYIGDIPKAHQDHIYLQYFEEDSLLQYFNKGYGLSIKELNYGDQIRISASSPMETPGFHVKKARVHVVYKPKEGFGDDEIESAVEEDSHQSVSIAEKLSEFFTSSACSCGVNEGESTSMKGANKRGRDDEDEDEVLCTLQWKKSFSKKVDMNNKKKYKNSSSNMVPFAAMIHFTSSFKHLSSQNSSRK